VCMIQTIYLNSFWKSNYSLARKWVQDYPQDPKGYSILGIVYFRAGLCSEAVAAIDRSLALGMVDPRAYYMLGACSRDDAEKAMVCFGQALALAPEYAAPYQGLGELFYHQKKYDEAREFLLRAVQLQPSVLGFGYLIKTDLALGRGNEAGMVFVQAQRQIKNKDDLDFLYALLTFEPTGQPHVKGAAQ